jgi:heavy metal sensor kinase
LARKRDVRRLSRGLRFRLTASYALFFAMLLIAVAVLFRQRLDKVLERQVTAALDDQWAAMKGYLRIEKRRPSDRENKAAWYYDAADLDETRIVLDLKQMYLIADAKGQVILDEYGERAVSAAYQYIGEDPPALIKKRVEEMLKPEKTPTIWETRWDETGEQYRVRAGIVWDQKHKQPYYVAIGTPLSQYSKILRGFTWIFVAVIPGALVLGALLGWFMAGRSLQPVLSVAQAAQRISGSNLSLRIPTREAGDELDYLILTFNRMIERLENSFQQMRQFSTDVSHELRTPITAIRGQLEVALFTAKTTEQYREAIFNALQDIDRLSQIVRALLLLSQAESGQLVLQKSRLDLSEVAGDLAEQFQIPAEESGVRLIADLPAECPAEVDRVQIERMLTNLLSNAIKFTPKGGEVRLTLKPHRDRVEILVADTGRGISSEHLPHIFERFYRVPGSGTGSAPDEGLGLGLSFVAWIVKAHRGKIDVESHLGEGTRFRITLPSDGLRVDTLEMAGQRA